MRLFFTGDTDEGPDERTIDDFERTPRAIVTDMMSGGMTFPWTLMVSLALGVLLMLSPLVFSWGSGVAATNHIVGALVITFTIAALAPVARLGRFLNTLLGIVRIRAACGRGGLGGADILGALRSGTDRAQHPAWQGGWQLWHVGQVHKVAP